LRGHSAAGKRKGKGKRGENERERREGWEETPPEINFWLYGLVYTQCSLTLLYAAGWP